MLSPEVTFSRAHQCENVKAVTYWLWYSL